MSQHATEVATGQRFEFGTNWTRFLQTLNDDKIAEAIVSLKKMLGTESLAGNSFLDIGSGSGLFSLAARRLAARVHSFDYDPNSVNCTAELKRRYYPDDSSWTVESGSVLDVDYLESLGQFDVVYSWGVLHHTGQMWTALANAAPLVAPGGKLFIALYNDQGTASRRWTKVKKFYNEAPQGCGFWRFGLRSGFSIGAGSLRTSCAANRFKPFGTTARTNVAGFLLARLLTCSGALGCNEFVFEKSAPARS